MPALAGPHPPGQGPAGRRQGGRQPGPGPGQGVGRPPEPGPGAGLQGQGAAGHRPGGRRRQAGRRAAFHPGRGPAQARAGADLPVGLVALGRPVEALDGALPSRWLDAARAFAAGDPARAAKLYAEIGSRPDEAAARLAAARRLLPTRPAEGRIELERAIAFFREAGATASLDQAKELLFALT